MIGPTPTQIAGDAAAATALGQGPGPGDARPASSYDAVPYSVGAYPQTRPDRLATVGRLFGMSPADPRRCRVLELGCAAGGNLIPMALDAPASHFVGIDLSARQIADARACAGQLDVRNLDLRAASILDLDHDDLGEFDYVLCHGVYSWVPPDVQEKILAICARNLAPQGVAYVSYNCYPGWHARAAIREMLWYHTAPIAEPAARVRAARGLLAFLLKCAPANATGGFGALVRQELVILLATPDSYLLHEHLEEFNEPLYFHQFAARAVSHGLQYLGEANVGAMSSARLGPEADAVLRHISPDLLHMEQYMDFLRNTMFRQTLLCRAGVPLDHTLRPASVAGMYVTSRAKRAGDAPVDLSAGVEAAFAGVGEQTLTTRDPVMKAAMLCLAEASPNPLRFDDLVAAARARVGSPQSADADAQSLATRLLNCYVSGLADFSVAPPAFTTRISARPVASPYARHRAREGGKVINVRLETIQLDPPALLVLAHLDGRPDRAALAALLNDWLRERAAGKPAAGQAGPDEPPPPERVDQFVASALDVFAASALLVG